MLTRTFIVTTAAFVALVSAGPAPPPPPPPPPPPGPPAITSPTVTLPGACTRTLCADYINSCGKTYGGCYPACSGYTTPHFTDPGCPTTTASTTSFSATAPGCHHTVCVDSVNACGKTYGGCYESRSGYTTPSFTDPGCPSTTSSTSYSVTLPGVCTRSICADYVNACGKTYGGCYPACSGYTTPHFTDPGCPTTTSSVSVTSHTNTPVCTKTTCISSTNSCGKTYSGCYPACSGFTIPGFKDTGCSTTTSTPPTSTFTSSVCTRSLCDQRINSCGLAYGGCYPACSGYTVPSFTDPGCPTTTPKPPSSSPPITTSKPSISTSCTQTVCADFINSCGRTYGGCYPACSGYTRPSFTDPGCPTSTSTKPTTSSPPITTSKPTSVTSSICSNIVCRDYVNSCGKTYGGCYNACPGYTTPSFTDPGCATTTSKPTTTSKSSTITTRTTCTSTICADYVNSCGQTYGGCYAACSGYTTPHFTDPGCPTITSTSTSLVTLPTSSCGFVCKDYFDKCGNTYGPGCYTSCPGAKEPTYSTPSCSLTTAPITTTTGPVIVTLPTSSCGVKCQDYFDKCGNTYGPGCYTSCSGAKEPTYSTLSCSLTAVATSVAATSIPVLTLSNPAGCGNRC